MNAILQLIVAGQYQAAWDAYQTLEGQRRWMTVGPVTRSPSSDAVSRPET